MARHHELVDDQMAVRSSSARRSVRRSLAACRNGLDQVDGQVGRLDLAIAGLVAELDESRRRERLGDLTAATRVEALTAGLAELDALEGRRT